MPLRPRSLRARLTLWYTGVLAALLLVFGAAALVLLDRALRANVDTSLATLARTIATSTAARDAPTAAPSASASCSTRAKSSFEPRPQPPETTFAAPRRSGRPPVFSATSTEPIVAAATPLAVTSSVISASGRASARASTAP